MFIPDPGCIFFPSRIPDPNFSHLGSRIRIKRFKYFNTKIVSKLSEIWLGLFIPDPDLVFFFYPSRIPDPGWSRGQRGTGSRIPDPDPQHCLKYQSVCPIVGIGSPPSPPACDCVSALGPRGGSNTLLQGEGTGGNQFGLVDRKPGNLYTLWQRLSKRDILHVVFVLPPPPLWATLENRFQYFFFFMSSFICWPSSCISCVNFWMKRR
jgi:hypothetical protein